MEDEFGRGLTVLVVDDEQPVLDLFKVSLEAHGFRVHTAQTLKDARALRTRFTFDLVLVDKNLPDGSGLDIARDVVTQSADCDVVIITAFSSTESAIDALQLGVADYIEKPFEMENVESRLKRVTGTLRLRRENRQLLTELAKKNRALEHVIEGLRVVRGIGSELDGLEAHSEPEEISQIDRTIANQSMGFVYQPIRAADGDDFLGWEALCRPLSDPFGSPDELLAAASRAGRVSGLGEVLRTLAIRPFIETDREGLVFVNLHPQEVGGLLVQWAERFQFLASHIVLELADSDTTWASGAPNRELNSLREMGFGLGLDGLPHAYLALDVVEAFQPRFIRVRAARILDPIHDREARRLQHVLSVCKDIGVSVIAHKIENQAQRDAVVDAGVDYLQGNLIGEPGNPFQQAEA